MSVNGLARVIAPYERQVPSKPDNARARQAESKLKRVTPDPMFKIRLLMSSKPAENSMVESGVIHLDMRLCRSRSM